VTLVSVVSSDAIVDVCDKSRAVMGSTRGRGTGGALASRETVALCPASKPYDKGDADGQQGAGEPERDECLAPLRAVAHRIEDPDADAPRVERPNERGDDSKAQRAESRQPGGGAPKHTATCRFRAHGSMMRVAARAGQRATASLSPTGPKILQAFRESTATDVNLVTASTVR
jgi:hypothetical protein